MTPTAAELLESAKALPREERAELAEGLIATLGQADVSDEARLTALRTAVDAAEESIAAGRVIRVPAGGLRDYIRSRGERAAGIADAQPA